MAKVAVIYYSSTGTVHEMAGHAVAAAEKAGAEVRLRKVAELAPDAAIASNEAWAAHAEATSDVEHASLDDLEWADVLAFGTPTRYGLPTAQLKQFIDTSGPLWQQGKLVGKVATSFTSTATTHGGQESTILALNNTFYHWGCVIVSPGYADPVMFDPANGNPYGVSVVGGSGVSEPQVAALGVQMRRAVEVADALVAAR
ncbi:MAG TPA: NAD(P)H:quinone oxidoreductase [Phytomonospora sp.]